MTSDRPPATPSASPATGGAARAARLGKLLVALVLVGVALWWLRPQLEAAVDWVRELGPWGPLALGALYVLSCVLFVPGSILTLAAGALFGVVQGTIVVSLASTLGATLAMLVGRTVARDWVAKLVAGNARFAAVDAAVAREGFKIVLLTRLSPVFPFNMLNFAYGLTRVSVRDYLLASWIGMIPGTILYVYLGSLAGDVAGAGEGTSTRWEWAMKLVGLAATVVVTVYVTRLARRALAEVSPSAGRAP